MAELTEKQWDALDTVTHGHSLYIGGPAGTGKSFLLNEIVTVLRSAGRSVYLTCTTGIACTNFPPALGAMTVHRWSGIQDGRYSSKEVVSMINNNVKFKDALHRIHHTDTLIIDEVSMLSDRLFNQLGEVCSLKDPSKLFGGIQLILCGDFVQLPPVPNTLYNDDGKYCFQSQLFEQTISHHIFLDQIVRQSEVLLIRAIREVSWGELSDETNQFVNTLQRPLDLSPGKHSIKLFATNYLVDSYNRKCVVEARGDIGEYCAEDTGQERYLSRLLAPKILWLKVGSPIILLRNLTNELFNGLRGTIIRLETEGPVVKFPTANETVKIQKMTFTVFSPQHQCNLAERVQVPLKLAYALSIHKSHGMTLDSVDVDCQQMFKPGQLGVAMGRVKTTAGLRVINFAEQVCLPQPDCIKDFVQKLSMPRLDNLTCCRVERLDEFAIQQIFDIQDIMWIEADVETNEHAVDGTIEEEEFDDVFDKVLASTVFINSDEIVDFVLPPEFNLNSVLDCLKNDNTYTPLMKEVNDLVSTLLSNNFQAAQEFSKKEFLALSAILETLNVTEPAAVKTEHLSDFYRKCYLHQTSDEYKLNCMILFQDMPQYADAREYISYNITTEIRKFLLQEKVNLFPVCNKTTSTRHITSGCRARVRYVGGYCVSKTRYKYMKQQNNACFQTSVAAQRQYEEASCVVKCLDTMRENECYLEKHSNSPETLLDVARKQNISRGLTHITDELYTFFMLLCEQCLSSLTDTNLHTYGEQLYNHCIRVITDSSVLHEQFVNALALRTKVDHFSASVDEDILVIAENVLGETVLRAHAIDTIYMEICKKFLMVMLNQYRKDLLQALSVEKTMAHRKQILIRKSKGSDGMPNVTFDSIVKDQTDGKIMSHNLIKGLLLRKSDIFQTFKKVELTTLAKAYCVKTESRHTKAVIIKNLIPAVTQVDSMKNSSVFANQTPTLQPASDVPHKDPQPGPSRSDAPHEDPQPGPSRSDAPHEDPQPGPSRSDAPNEDPQPGPSRSDAPHEDPHPGPSRYDAPHEDPHPGMVELSTWHTSSDSDEEDKCKVCNKSTGSVQWIQCENCGGWLHRNCAGLKQQKQWKRWSRRGAKYFCKECQ